MRSQILDTQSKLRVVQGLIATVPTNGLDWNVYSIGVGSYIVRFTPRFKSILSIEATMVSAGGFIVVLSAQSDYMQINTYATNAASQNNAFSFTVQGIPLSAL